MAVSWSRNQIGAELRAVLLTPRGARADHTVVQVVDNGDLSDAPADAGFTVLFRWLLDPTTYAVSLPMKVGTDDSALPVPGPWRGAQFNSLREWVLEAAFWLSEELGTGFVRRARRTQLNGVVSLDIVHAPDVMPVGYFVGRVPLGNASARPGEHLAREGFDIQPARRLWHDGHLVGWRQAYVNNQHGRPFVGHTYLSWVPSGAHETLSGRTSVHLDAVELTPGTPSTVAVALAFHGLRDAADGGAIRARTNLAGPVVHQLGFRATETDGMLAITLSSLQVPRLSPR